MLGDHSLEEILDTTIHNIYNNKSYPTRNDFVVDENSIVDICNSIIRDLGDSNNRIINYTDPYYMIRLELSLSSDIPLIAESSKQHKNYYYRYGELKVAFSKLGKYVMFYWRVHKNIFNIIPTGSNMFSPPHIAWCDLISRINNIINSNGYKLIQPPLLFKKYNIHYDGQEYTTDKPTLITLLFDQEIC